MNDTKTQNVCKHCPNPEMWHGHQIDTLSFYHPFEPVAEPAEPSASTGEPPKCSCPCHKGESVICNCGGGFECEYINSIPKVEEIARKLHLYHCQERRSGSMCPCHAVAEGMTEGCNCKEETADIATILRRYFPSDIDIEKKYLIALRWFKLFYNFYQKAIEGKPSAAMSAMSEDSELQELLREADRIR